MRTEPDRVTILLGLRNGARFLPAQLDSLARQEGCAWRLLVSDDGSTDRSREIVADFARNRGGDRVELGAGPGLGFAENYRTMLAIQDGTGPLAFADQDDLWHTHRLARAIAALRELPPDCPALYCSAVRVMTGRRPEGPIWFRAVEPGFRHALVQNIAGGNTMVLNAAGAALVAAAARLSGRFVSHDWFAYQIITAAGGRVIHDRFPGVLYRQHRHNTIGAAVGLAAQARRARALLAGRYARNLDIQLAALARCRALMLPEAAALLDRISEARAGGRLATARAVSAEGLHRAGRSGHAVLVAAALFGRL
ncbi:MAG: glycosyltransferase [Rubricella sp.]